MAHRQLDVAVHRRDGVVSLAAALRQLGSNGVVALHYGREHLVGCHVELVANAANLLAQTVHRGNNVVACGVEGGRQGLDVVAIALHGLHDDSGIGIVVNHRDDTALPVWHHAAAKATAKEVAPAHEDKEKQDGKQAVSPTVTVTLAVAKGKQTWVNALPLHERREHCQYSIKAAARASRSVLTEYVSL